MFPNTGLHSNISPPDQYSSFAEWKLELNDQHNTSLRLKFKLQARGEKFTAADLSRACIHIDMPSPRIEANEEMLRYMLRQALRLGNYVRQLTGANVKLTANINTDQVWADEEIKTLNLESVQADARLTRRALKSSILAHVILYFDTSKSGPVLH